MHSKFRRLKGKTQVFIDPAGDHYRTRITHTLETTGIAPSRARAATERGSDRGDRAASTRPPTLRACGRGAARRLLQKNFARFRHNEQSLRIAEELNLTEEVRNGILTHTGEQEPATLEGKIVRLVDRPPTSIMTSTTRSAGAAHAGRPAATEIELLARPIDAHRHARPRPDRKPETAGDIVQSDDVGAAMLALRSFMFEQVYSASTRGRSSARTRPSAASSPTSSVAATPRTRSAGSCPA